MNTCLQECYKSKNAICQDSKKINSTKHKCLDRVAHVIKLLIGGDTVHKHVVKVPGLHWTLFPSFYYPEQIVDRVADITKLLIGGDTVHKHVVKMLGLHWTVFPSFYYPEQIVFSDS